MWRWQRCLQTLDVALPWSLEEVTASGMSTPSKVVMVVASGSGSCPQHQLPMAGVGSFICPLIHSAVFPEGLS